MQVMKLGNSGVATAQHFDIGLSGDRREALGAHSARQFIHAFAPGPEIVFTIGRSLFGSARQRALKRVAVRVAQARNQAVGPDILVADGGSRRNRLNTAGGNR